MNNVNKNTLGGLTDMFSIVFISDDFRFTLMESYCKSLASSAVHLSKRPVAMI